MFRVPVDGRESFEPVVLCENIKHFSFCMNGERVAYMSDCDSEGVSQLYSIRTDGGEAPVRLNDWPVTGGNVHAFGVSPDGNWIVYEADQDTSGVTELYGTPADGSLSAIKLNPPLASGGSLLVGSEDLRENISPNGQWVSYPADQEVKDVYELYTVPLTGGLAIKRSLPGTQSLNPGKWAGDKLIYDSRDGGLYCSTRVGAAVAISLAAAQAEATNTFPIHYDVLFDAEVQDLTPEMFVNTGTAPGVQFALEKRTPSSYRLSVVGTNGDGTILPQLPADLVSDASGVSNLDALANAPVVLDQTPPEIAIAEENPQIVSCPEEFVLPSVQAVDARDGAVPVTLVSNPVDTGTLGDYAVVFQATDSLGNVGQAVLQVTVADVEAPVLSLLGSTRIQVSCGGVFVDPGATASDACAGTVSVSVEATVDTAEPAVSIRSLIRRTTATETRPMLPVLSPWSMSKGRKSPCLAMPRCAYCAARCSPIPAPPPKTRAPARSR